MIRLIEQFLLILLGLVAVTVFAGAIFIMVDMGGVQVSQGGRYYVAVFALFALGVVAVQIQKILERRIPFSLTTTPQESRYALIGLLSLIAAGIVLIGVAWMLGPAPR